MSRLTRYFLWEEIRIFGMALFLFSFVFVAIMAVTEAIRSGLPIRMIPEILPYTALQMAPFTIPLAFLLAVTTVFSNFSTSGEFTALKALGVAPATIIWPTLLLSILLSLVTVRVNDLAVSEGRPGLQRVICDAAEEILYEMLRMNRKYDSSAFSISVNSVRGKTLEQVTIVSDIQGRKAILRADAAEIRRVEEPSTDGGAPQIFLELAAKNVLMQVQGEDINAQTGDWFRYRWPLPPIEHRPWDAALSQIPEELRLRDARIRRNEEDLAAMRALQLLSGSWSEAGNPHEEQLRIDNIQHARDEQARLRSEPFRRWASGFSCFSFAWLGMVLGLSPRLRSSDFWYCLACCFVPILIIYFPIFLGTLNLAKQGVLLPHILWAGNLVLILIGLAMFRPIRQH